NGEQREVYPYSARDTTGDHVRQEPAPGDRCQSSCPSLGPLSLLHDAPPPSPSVHRVVERIRRDPGDRLPGSRAQRAPLAPPVPPRKSAGAEAPKTVPHALASDLHLLA